MLFTPSTISLLLSADPTQAASACCERYVRGSEGQGYFYYSTAPVVKEYNA